MGLRLVDKWVWDFWFAEDGGTTHVFYLQAPRALGDPDLRHRHATLGHAVSSDLRRWTVLPDPLPASPAGAWDDLATWTGSVIARGGTWYLLYTGISTNDRGLVQRIGVATSWDLERWERYGDAPVLEADPTWYEPLDVTVWPDQAWRDPWVFRDPDGNRYHALITARSGTGPADARGVIGHAVSSDLLSWEVRPPLDSPAGFGQLEVPQVVEDGDTALLVFSTARAQLSAGRRRTVGDGLGTGTYVCRGPGPLGPFAVPETTPLLPATDLYSGKLVRRGGGWFLMGFVDTVDGDFVGEISDPVPFDPGNGVPIVEAGMGPTSVLS